MILTASCSLILLMPQVKTPAVAGLTIPTGNENLFERLIRDPTAPNRPARERLCAEMLCGLLMNTSATQQALLRLLANLADINLQEFDELDWSFATEQPIGTKRDDLRIEGWTHTDEPERVVLWTVEVKVGAGIHLSGNQLWNDEDGPTVQIVDEADPQRVSQIKNYDAWLYGQPVKYRAGFVLAITDQSQNIPPALSMPWHCLRWTGLAQAIEDQLREARIPESEQMLARHFCGFVRSHLWNEETMLDSRFGFDDLALMRAFSQIGFSCFGKVKELAAGCRPVLKELLAGSFDKDDQTKALNSANSRSAAYVTFHAGNLGKSTPPTLYAGIVGGEARVWLENPQTSPAKSVVQRIVKKSIGNLLNRNPNWEVVEDSTWTDLALSKPLQWLLTADDQQASLNDFVANAVRDLKAVGIIDCINKELRQE